MTLSRICLVILTLLSACSACNKETLDSQLPLQSSGVSEATTTTTTETFESGTKTSYTAGNVTLATGSWNLNDALLGTSTSDAKDGSQSVRIRNSGTLTMNFNLKTGASAVTIKHAEYGSDGTGTWQLWYSTNSGSSYKQTGSTVTSSSATLATASFTINVQGNIRFQVRKTDGGSNRINIDDFSVKSYGTNSSSPAITSVSPDTVTAGAAAFTVTVKGTKFTSASTINFNDTALTTTYVSTTKLTAAVPAAKVASASTDSITVVTAGITTAAVAFVVKLAGTGSTAKKFLFDATKAETAGNADWVIDEDNNTPQRIPTPAQSTITSSTAETYWTGALSSWGIALVKAGDM